MFIKKIFVDLHFAGGKPRQRVEILISEAMLDDWIRDKAQLRDKIFDRVQEQWGHLKWSKYSIDEILPWQNLDYGKG